MATARCIPRSRPNRSPTARAASRCRCRVRRLTCTKSAPGLRAGFFFGHRRLISARSIGEKGSRVPDPKGHPLKKLIACMALPLALASLSGCNAGAIALAAYSNHGLDSTQLSGVVANTSADVRVGYITWIEQLQSGNVQGK